MAHNNKELTIRAGEKVQVGFSGSERYDNVRTSVMSVPYRTAASFRKRIHSLKQFLWDITQQLIF